MIKGGENSKTEQKKDKVSMLLTPKTQRQNAQLCAIAQDMTPFLVPQICALIKRKPGETF